MGLDKFGCLFTSLSARGLILDGDDFIPAQQQRNTIKYHIELNSKQDGAKNNIQHASRVLKLANVKKAARHGKALLH